MSRPASPNQHGLRWSIASLALAVCGAAALLIVPTSTTGSETVVVGGREVSHVTNDSSETLLQAGPLGYALLLLLVPIALTALPLLLRRHWWVDHVRGLALLLLVFILPAGFFGQGGFYLPSAIAMLGALLRDRPDREVTSQDVPDAV